jgi:hypothetical protein
MFWFYRNNGNQPEARVVFCAPSIKAFTVKASATLSNRNLTSVTEINNYTAFNDVFDGDNAGKAFNAVIFNTTTNRFIAARGIATNTGVPGTIFKAAQLGQGDTGLQQTFDNPNGFLDLTNTVYVRYLLLYSFFQRFSHTELTRFNRNNTYPSPLKLSTSKTKIAPSTLSCMN